MSALSLTKDKVVLLQLTSSDLLLESVATQIHINVQALLVEDIPDLIGVVVDRRHNWNDQDLSRTEPERPLAGKVFSQNTKHALKAAHDGTVDHYRARVASGELLRRVASIADTRLILACHVSKLESSGKVKVELNGTALVVSTERIVEGNINLGAVESTITVVELPLGVVLLGKGCECLLELLLGNVPGSNIANVLLRARRQLELERESKDAVDTAQEIKTCLDLLPDL